MQIQISWLLRKPTDLDLHCLQRQGISGFSRTRVKSKLQMRLGSQIIVLLFLHENIGCGYSLDAPHQHMFLCSSKDSTSTLQLIKVPYLEL